MTEQMTLKAQREQLQESLVRLALDPSLPKIEVIEHFRENHARLQFELTDANVRIEQVSKCKAEYEPLESDLRRKQQDRAKLLAKLEQLATPLGKAVVEAIQSGVIEPLAAFQEGVKSHESHSKLKAEYEALKPGPQAGLMDTLSLKAQQLVVAGKIKLEEAGLYRHETSGGKRLLSDASEESVRCDRTAETLALIANARSEIAEKQRDVEEAAAVISAKEADLCLSLGLSQVDGMKSLETELSRCRQHQTSQDVARQNLEREFCDEIVAVDILPQHEEFVRRVSELRQSMKETSGTKPLYSVRGRQDLLEVFDNKVAITPKGVLGFLNKGIKGTKEIPIASITAVQFKKAGMMNGYLQFTIPGGNESRKGMFAATKDENSFFFTPDQNDVMAEVKAYIEKRMTELRTPQVATPISSPSASSLSDELQKLAHLHAQGILSAEEFKAAKNRLIGQ